MTTRCIFLDIDGPMIPVRAYFLANQTSPVSIFDPCASALLLRLLEESSAKIVISSIWGQHGRERCEDLLRKNGIDPSYLHEDWVTPRKMSSARIHEIAWWLNRHPEVTHHVAIDDEDLLSEFVPNAVLCDGAEGFSMRNYHECEVFLGIAEDTGRILYEKRREIWRLARVGDPMKHTLWQIADELFPLS